MKKVVRSRRVLVDGSIVAASIHIDDGTVLHIGAWEEVPRDVPVMDFGGHILMAGLVDSHVHVNEPGRTEWEGFETATRAAAAGGITTIVDMPLNSIPATTTVAALQQKAAAMAGKCQVDVGLWGGAVPGNVRELRPMLQAGALGFKCFLIESGVPEFGHLDASGLKQALQTLGPTGAPLLVHAELEGPIASAHPSGDRRTYRHYLESRPDAAETEAIELVAGLCGETGARAHIVHLSAAGGVPLIRDARRRGVSISAETTPHYLHFIAEEIPDGATEYKCAPPVRAAKNRERLWEALRDGDISLVVSDHSPCTPNLKKREAGDFMEAWGGIASVQFLLPAVWTEAKKRDFDIPFLSNWMSAAPAELAGIHDRKGRLAAGRDADFVVWNPEESFVVTPEIIAHRHKLTPYLGETLFGKVIETWVRGECVYREGQFFEATGTWVRGRA